LSERESKVDSTITIEEAASKLKKIMKPLRHTYERLSVPSSEIKYNQHTTEVKQDITATTQILSLLLASSRIDSKFIKQK
jgi:uncharacterized membrane protein